MDIEHILKPLSHFWWHALPCRYDPLWLNNTFILLGLQTYLNTQRRVSINKEMFTLEEIRRPWGEGELQLYSSFSLSTSRGYVANTMSRPLYPRKRPSTHCTRRWPRPKAGLDGSVKSQPHRHSIPGCPAHCESLYQLNPWIVFVLFLFWIFLLCLWSDQVKCEALSLVFNLWIGPGFSFESCS